MSHLKTNLEEVLKETSRLNKIATRILEHKPKIDVLEYIESTGTQWIDTGFYPRSTNTNIKVENKFNVSSTKSSEDNCVLGARTGAGVGQGFKLPNYYKGDLEIQAQMGAGYMTGSYSINTDYIFSAELNLTNQKFYLNNTFDKEFTSSTANCNSGGNLYLLALNQNGPKWQFCGKLYYCKIWEDDVLVRDFVPAKDETDVVCLYDYVTEQYFYNAGTGEFIARR